MLFFKTRDAARKFAATGNGKTFVDMGKDADRRWAVKLPL